MSLPAIDPAPWSVFADTATAASQTRSLKSYAVTSPLYKSPIWEKFTSSLLNLNQTENYINNVNIHYGLYIFFAQ